jgi:hypothetical protein
MVVVVVLALAGGSASAEAQDLGLVAGVPHSALAPRVRIAGEEPMVIYARRVEDGAAFYSRFGLSLPERMRPPAQRICLSPCEPRLARGYYAMAVGRPGSTPTAVRAVVAIHDDARDFTVSYESNDTERTVGRLVALGGALLTLASAFASGIFPESSAHWAMGIGMTAGLTIASIGAYFAFEPDEARVVRADRRR